MSSLLSLALRSCIMTSLKRRKIAQMYTVGWIAAFPNELAAAIGMLDEKHQKPKDFIKAPRRQEQLFMGPSRCTISTSSGVVANLGESVH